MLLNIKQDFIAVERNVDNRDILKPSFFIHVPDNTHRHQLEKASCLLLMSVASNGHHTIKSRQERYDACNITVLHPAANVQLAFHVVCLAS